MDNHRSSHQKGAVVKLVLIICIIAIAVIIRYRKLGEGNKCQMQKAGLLVNLRPIGGEDFDNVCQYFDSKYGLITWCGGPDYFNNMSCSDQSTKDFFEIYFD